MTIFWVDWSYMAVTHRSPTIFGWKSLNTCQQRNHVRSKTLNTWYGPDPLAVVLLWLLPLGLSLLRTISPPPNTGAVCTVRLCATPGVVVWKWSKQNYTTQCWVCQQKNL